MDARRTQLRVLVADDDERILACYEEAFMPETSLESTQRLRALSAELFSDQSSEAAPTQPDFDLVSCRQGDDAVKVAAQAVEQGDPFDVVILDVRMPPGISGIEAGKRIRAIDACVNIIFVSAYSDVRPGELGHRIPPPDRLRFLSKPISFSDLVRTARKLAGGLS